MKHCPKCRTKRLTSARTSKYKVDLDYCPSCKGIWFDRGELEILLNTPGETLRLPPHAKRSPLICPVCNEAMRFFFFPRTLVGVEMCPGCKGLWLEPGEFREIGTVTGHLRRSGVYAAEPPERNGLKASLVGWINDTISSLLGW